MNIVTRIHQMSDNNISVSHMVKNITEDLKECTYKNTKKFSFKGQKYDAKCIKVYDGDTITVACLLFGEYQKFSVRMLKYDSPELGHRAKSPAEAAWAKVAKETLAEKILGKLITIHCNDFAGGYGVRVLGEIYCDGENINDFMLGKLFTQPCSGKRKEWFFTEMPDGTPIIKEKKIEF